MKDNKLIAEFMDIPSYKQGRYLMFEYADNNHRTEQDLAYHNSWDWLMKVVNKIKRTDLSREMVMQGIDELITEIDDSFDYNIAITYDAVVKFIEEYNKVKRNS